MPEPLELTKLAPDPIDAARRIGRADSSGLQAAQLLALALDLVVEAPLVQQAVLLILGDVELKEIATADERLDCALVICFVAMNT